MRSIVGEFTDQEKHFSKLDDRCYQDQSLHLLAFDLMYCSRTYSFYHDLPVPARQRSAKKITAAEKAAIVDAQKEEERRAKVKAVEKELDELESFSDGSFLWLGSRPYPGQHRPDPLRLL